jgi:sterol-4alpha-carboxylate 3-dehydrogenase (decarboxylating)
MASLASPAATTPALAPVRVLVTGGSGFLGTYIVEQLLADASTSVAIVSRSPKPPTDDARLSIHAADIASEAQLQAVFDQVQPQCVIHTASPHHFDSATVLARTNIEGTKLLLKCAQACPVTRAFVYTSSDSAIAPTTVPLTEAEATLYNQVGKEDAKHHVTPYGRSKAVADAAVLTANGEELSTAVIRLPAIYGERDPNFIPQLVASVRNKEHKMQIGANVKLFEFVYVAKAAEAHVLAARALTDPRKAPNVAGEAFFISDGRPEPFFDFARRCYAAMGNPVAPSDVTIIPMPAMRVIASAGEWAYKILTLGTKTPKVRREGIDHLDRGACWSIDKAKQRLGYEPVTDQDAAIKKSMDWAEVNL